MYVCLEKTESLFALIKERNRKQQCHCVRLGGYGFAVIRSGTNSPRIFSFTKHFTMSKMKLIERIAALLITIIGIALLVIAKS